MTTLMGDGELQSVHVSERLDYNQGELEGIVSYCIYIACIYNSAIYGWQKSPLQPLLGRGIAQRP